MTSNELRKQLIKAMMIGWHLGTRDEKWMAAIADAIIEIEQDEDGKLKVKFQFSEV